MERGYCSRLTRLEDIFDPLDLDRKSMHLFISEDMIGTDEMPIPRLILTYEGLNGLYLVEKTYDTFEESEEALELFEAQFDDIFGAEIRGNMIDRVNGIVTNEFGSIIRTYHYFAGLKPADGEISFLHFADGLAESNIRDTAEFRYTIEDIDDPDGNGSFYSIRGHVMCNDGCVMLDSVNHSSLRMKDIETLIRRLRKEGLNPLEISDFQ